MSRRMLRRSLVAASLLSMALAGSLLWHRKSGVEVDQVARVQSPDGRYEATLEWRVYTGYLGGNPARSEVRVSRTGGSPAEGALVFASDMGPSYTKLEWSAPGQLRVGYNHFASDVYKKENAGDVTV